MDDVEIDYDYALNTPSDHHEWNDEEVEYYCTGDFDQDDDYDSDDFDLEEFDAVEFTPEQQFVEDLSFRLVKIDAPGWYINPDFKLAFNERSDWDNIAACAPLSFAPGMLAVLTAPSPPSLDFLKSTPEEADDCELYWEVYGVIMEKEGCTPLFYCGSGTNAVKGAPARKADYKPGSSTLPKNVRLAFEKGFKITHHGSLCWTPLPPSGLVPRVRARFLVLEAFFTVQFRAKKSAITNIYYQHLLLWNTFPTATSTVTSSTTTSTTSTTSTTAGMDGVEIDPYDASTTSSTTQSSSTTSSTTQSGSTSSSTTTTATTTSSTTQSGSTSGSTTTSSTTQSSTTSNQTVEWEPLCSHLSLSEGVRGDLNLTAEQLELAAKLRRERVREKGRRFKAALKEEDPDYILGIAKKVRNTAKSLRRFECQDCDLVFASDSALQKHNRSKTHADCLAGKSKGPLSQYAVNLQVARAKNRASGMFHCRPCNKDFGNDWSLRRHKDTPLHARKLAKAKQAGLV